MAIPFLVSIRFLCRACQSRLLGGRVGCCPFVQAIRLSRSSVKFSMNWVSGVMSLFGNATTRCGMLSRGMRWSLHTFAGQQLEIFMVVERMRRGRISIRFTVVLRMWLGMFARRSLRYVGRKMKMRVADT